MPAFGNEWYPRNMYLQDSREFVYHQKVFGHQSKFGYKDFIPLLTAEKFDAGAVGRPVPAGGREVRRAGGRASRWLCDVRQRPQPVDRGQDGAEARHRRRAGRGDAQGRHGVRRLQSTAPSTGGSSTAASDFGSDVQDPAYADLYGPATVLPNDRYGLDVQPRPDAAFLEDWLARCCELVDKYQPQLFWFDWWIEQVVFQPYLQRFAAYYYNRGQEWGKGVAINYKNKSFPEQAAVLDIERGQLKDIRPMLWQNDTSVSKNSWGYIQHHDYKAAVSIIHDLVDVVSKNGALLLNIGPKPDGTIPEPEQAMLLEIGRWLAINGEAIYGTRPWKVYGEGPTEVFEGGFTDTKRAGVYQPRCALHDEGRCALCDRDGLAGGAARRPWAGCAPARRSTPAEIQSVTLLGSAEPLQWSRDNAGLKVRLPGAEAAQRGVCVTASSTSSALPRFEGEGAAPGLPSAWQEGMRRRLPPSLPGKGAGGRSYHTGGHT